MKVFWLPLLLFGAVLAQMETGLATDPPVTCKLKLVRLEPLPPGKPCPENEILLRSVRGQGFYSHNGLTGNAMRDERIFRDTIHKEPKEYQAVHPLRAVAWIGNREYCFVLDTQSKKSQGYDRLYFDLNGNGDLTDDVPIDVPEDCKPKDSIKSENGRISTIYRFPRVDFKIHAEEGVWDYSFFLEVGTNTNGQDVFCHANLASAAYREGEITLEGRKHKLVLVDWNTRGRFDVSIGPTSVSTSVFIGSVSNGNGVGGPHPRHGTEILFDSDIPRSRKFLACRTRARAGSFLPR